LRRPLVLLLVALFAVPACGGGGASHEVQPVRDCLEEAGATTSNGVDGIAADAARGAFGVELPNGDDATLSFHNTAAQAESSGDAYRAFAEAFESSGRDDQHGNLLVAWNQDPADESEELLDSCL
jgi:hypothetical protein